MYRIRFENGQPVQVEEPIEAAPVAAPMAEVTVPDPGLRRMKSVGGRLIAVDVNGEPLVENPTESSYAAYSPAAASQQEATVSVPAEANVENLETRVRRIVDSITERGVAGKFPGAVMQTNNNLAPLEVPRTWANEYGVYGDRQDEVKDQFVLHTLLTNMRDDTKSAHHMVFTPVRNAQRPEAAPMESMVSYLYDSRYRSYQNRPSFYVLSTFFMPTESANTLRATIEAEPDAAEVFFQHAASGLDIERVESDRVVLLDGEPFYPYLQSNVYKGKELKAAYRENAQQHMYSRPQGSVPYTRD